MKNSNLNNVQFHLVSKKFVIFTLIAIASFSCKQKESESEETIIEEPIAEETVMAATLETGCYTYKDTSNMVSMEITKADNPVAGTLTYALLEKDQNTGSFKGTFTDGKLIGQYNFQSEGVESSRQVAFMFKDNQLIEGYGELHADGTSFADVSAINYTSTMPLSKMDCTE